MDQDYRTAEDVDKAQKNPKAENLRVWWAALRRRLGGHFNGGRPFVGREHEQKTDHRIEDDGGGQITPEAEFAFATEISDQAAETDVDEQEDSHVGGRLRINYYSLISETRFMPAFTSSVIVSLKSFALKVRRVPPDSK